MDPGPSNAPSDPRSDPLDGQVVEVSDDEARRRAVVALVRSGLITVAIVCAYFVLPLDWLARIHPLVSLPATLVAFVAVLVAQVRAISRSDLPGVRAVETLATTVPLLLVIFAASYQVIDLTAPGSFSESLSRLDALYLTVTVFATVGFGDITATSPEARIAVMIQMVVNLLVIGVGIRVIMGTVQATRQRVGRPPPTFGR